MKNNRFGFLMILAFAALASSCGTSGYYASSVYDDGIYYRPTAESRAKMVAAQEAQREKERQRQYDQYLAKDEDGNLYVVTELMDGETYESRLHKFDSPWYTNYAWYGAWSSPWYNPWWGSYRYPYFSSSWYWRSGWYDSWYWGYPYYGYYDPWYYNYGWGGWYEPWYWGAGYAGWYGYNRWYGHHYYPGYINPGPGPRGDRNYGRNMVYTPRNSATGSGIYRNTGASSASGNRGMYTTRRTSSGGSVSTRSSSGTVRSSGSRPTRTGSSGSSGSYTRSSGGSYSGGGSSRSSSGGGYSGGSSSSSGGHSVSGGNHSGGGRR